MQLIPSVSSPQSIAQTGDGSHTPPKSGSGIRPRSFSDSATLTGPTSSEKTTSLPSSSTTLPASSSNVTLIPSVNSSNHASSSYDATSPEKEGFLRYCAELIERTRPPLPKITSSSPTPRPNRLFTGLRKTHSRDATRQEEGPVIKPLNMRDLPAVCTTLLNYYRAGYRVFTRFRPNNSSVETKSLSWLVERVLDLPKCKTLINLDPKFAKQIGLLRFEALETNLIISDLERIQELFSTTRESRQALISFLEQRSAQLHRNAQETLGPLLDVDQPLNSTVSEFYRLAKLTNHLNGVSFEQQRTYLPLILQSPYRVLFEANAFIMSIPDALHNNAVNLTGQLLFLKETKKNPRQCLDDIYWREVLSHLTTIGKDKERIAVTLEAMVSRCMAMLREDGSITEDAKETVIQQLKAALPKEKKAANWEGLAALINAIRYKYRAFF